MHSRSRLRILFVGLAAAGVIPGYAVAIPSSGAAPIAHDISRLAIPFERNAGQFDPSVAYVARTRAGNVFVADDGRVVYALGSSAGGWSLVESFGGNPLAPQGAQRADTNISEIRGTDRSHWRSHIDAYEDVRLGRPWRGIDVALRAHGDNVEKIFTLDAGADAARIRVSIEGATRLAVNPDGALAARTPRGDVVFTAPIAYQTIDGVQHAVDVRYRLRGSHAYSFALGAHDAHYGVVIDPLIRATFAGGTNVDDIYAMTADAVTGDIIVAGRTNSPNFPGVAGGAQSTPPSGGFEDAFVARYNAGLTTLIQATFLGGSANDEAAAVAIDSATGDVIITGFTYSKDFPGTAGGAQPNPPDSTPNTQGAYVARLTGNLQTLLQATYLGGMKGPQPMAIAVNALGNVYVSGDTGNDFPANGYQITASIGTHAFIAQLSGDLTSVNHATYLAGTGNEVDNAALAIDPNDGDVVLGGKTESIDLPGTAGGAQSASAGNTDFYLARFDAKLNTLAGATYLGGSMVEEYIGKLIIDPVTSDVFVSGETVSSDFPGTAGGLQATFPGGGNLTIIMSRLDSTLGTLRQSTYLGVTGNSYGAALALDATSGDLFVAGQTNSTTFPGTAFGWQPALQGMSNVIVARVSPDLTALQQSTYLGSSGSNSAYALIINPVNNDLYVAGLTTGNTFPGTTAGAQPAPGSPNGEDGFIARITRDLKEGVYASSFEL